MAPAHSRIDGADFLSSSVSARADFIGARKCGHSPELVSSLGSRRPTGGDGSCLFQQQRGLAPRLSAWCRGVLDQLEIAAAQAQQRNQHGLMVPALGTCIPSTRKTLLRSSRQPQLKTTVSLHRTTATGSKDRPHSIEAEVTDDRLASHALRHLREAQFAMSSVASVGFSVLFGNSCRAVEMRTHACGLLASLLAPMASGAGAVGVAGGPSMAFCPIGFDCIPAMKGGTFPAIPEPTLQELEKGVLVATFVQGSLGIGRMCLGDVFSGAYALLLATLGYNSRKPGPASNWLKTYVLITFINGTMSGIDLIQQTLMGNYLGITSTLPLAVNCAHFVTLSVPWVSFFGAYCGWNHIKLQRKVAMEAYQQQMMMLMQQPPWPPPPLPFPLPGMQGMPGLPGMPGMQCMVEDGAPGRKAPPGRLPTLQETGEEEENDA